ncbi:GPI mannosyltransferase 4 [Monodelphis domestica]|uniref:GPI mannosyltransferase 4 n=1 Tax=Monodelphis domestica TaxID=13616 RepID=UPI0024E1CEBB|nr:GPI mannosyltransferase 4 [Monodelphis domestica]XP_056664237.1 GPI mannosyltransferase 4 [Monodelphis domestica]XP_056664238.1 GPI mannosyltransferase 4 [Monodelphis domestica]XP_056664239.1 GPI mannosyltransferase 4 [Monodelphis domestica]
MWASRVLWGSLGFLRIAWCLLPQTGYLHPDEFFQSPEVMAEDVLGLEVYRPWEFLPSSPCRTVVFPLLTSGSVFWLLELLDQLDLWPGSVSSYTLLVGPRLVFTALSFALDWAVYRAAPLWGADPWHALVLLAGSYVTLVFYTRTLANAMEGLLFMWLLVLVSPGLGSDGADGKPSPRGGRHSWLLGALVAAGFFNRPTFLGFALLPLLFWSNGCTTVLALSMKPLVQSMLELLPGAMLVATMFVAVDTWYYCSRLGLGPHLVLTPAHFLSYNLDPQNLAQHGTHLRLTHLAVNGVLLFGILHLEAVMAAWRALKESFSLLAQRQTPWAHAWTILNRQNVLLLFYFVPLALLSLFSHQEPRFLVPLLGPLTLFSSQKGRGAAWWRAPAVTVFNVLGALFFGCLHQGGLVPCLSHLEHSIHSAAPKGQLSHFTLLFTHTYMPPRYLLYLRGQEPPVEVIDLGGADSGALCQTLDQLTSQSICNIAGGDRLCRIFVVTPGTVREAVATCPFHLRNETRVFPHLTLEDPPVLSDLLGSDWRNSLELYILEVGERREQ